jgi:hypothetical protein
VSSQSLVYIGASLLGALVGGVMTLLVSHRSSVHALRARYGEAMLAALGAAHQKVEHAMSASDGGADETALRFTEEATAIWAQTELGSTLARGTRGRRAMQSWGLHFHDALTRGARTRAELEWLDQQLTTGEMLVIAWIGRLASSGDFQLPREEVERRFAPRYRDTDLPDYGARPAA